MSERTKDREVDEVDVGGVGGVSADLDDDLGVDVGPGETGADLAGDTAADDAATSGEAGLTRRAASRAESVFSPKPFVALLAAALVGVFGAGALIPVIPFTGFIGLLVVMVVGGLVSSRPRYVEAGVAGAASGALGLTLGTLTLTFVTGGLPVLAGAAIGAALSLVGFYAGRDVRDGLTRDLE